VPALVADLGEGVLDVLAPGVAVIGVAQQHLHEDDLEPQPMRAMLQTSWTVSVRR
jgi:hypothetical protein